MIVKVRRQAARDAASYWQTFSYDAQGTKTVAGILDELNQREELVDAGGKPCLACLEFVDVDAVDVLTLEPLSKFPVVTDLIVDRSCILEHQKDALMYLGSKRRADPREFEQQYTVARCLKCGLCLEACPNYVGGEGRFYGASLANEAYLLSSLSADRQRELKRQYRKHFERGCSKSLACRDVCPAKIATLSSIGYMNR